VTATGDRRPAREPENVPDFRPGGQRPPLCNGDLAITSTRLPGGGTTVEVARRQPDGTWLWAIDQPSLLSS
jgi:hypothetical protein